MGCKVKDEKSEKCDEKFVKIFFLLRKSHICLLSRSYSNIFVGGKIYEQFEKWWILFSLFGVMSWFFWYKFDYFQETSPKFSQTCSITINPLNIQHITFYTSSTPITQFSLFKNIVPTKECKYEFKDSQEQHMSFVYEHSRFTFFHSFPLHFTLHDEIWNFSRIRSTCGSSWVLFEHFFLARDDF